MIEQTLARWGVGSIRSLHPEDVPESGLTRAVNTALLPVLGGDSQVTMRPGFRQYARADVASTAYLIGLTQYVYGTTTLVPYVLGVTTDEQIWVMTSPTATTAAQGTGVTISTASIYQFTPAKGRVYAGVQGGTTLTIFRLAGSSAHYAYATGLTAPTASPTVESTSAGSMTGTYEFATTWYNENFVNESSLSSALSDSLSAASAVIARNDSTAPDGATHWRLYVRKAAISSKFQRLAAWSTATATTTITVDITDAQINGMTLQAPSTTENNPPPSGLRAFAWHQGRLFATDGTDVYYSNLDNPEAWNPLNVEYVASGDGQTIAGLLSLNELNLAVFKTDSIYLLSGDSPQTWEIRRVPGNVGASAVGGNTIAYGDGMVGFFGRHGMYLWDPSSAPIDISNEVWREILAQTNPTVTQSSGQVYFDPQGHRFLFFPHFASALPGFAAAESLAFPFSLLHKCWEATWWTGPGRSSMDWGRCGAVISYSQKQDARLLLSAAGGRALELSPDVWTDGAGNETGLNLTFTVSTSTSASLVCAHTGAIPASAYGSVLTVVDATLGTVHRTAYSYSTDSTSVTFTLTTPAASAPAENSIVAVDIPVMELETRALGVVAAAEREGRISSQMTRKKRFGRVFMDLAASGDVRCMLAFFRDAETTPVRCWTPVIEQNYVRDLLSSQPASITGSLRAGIFRAGTTGWRATLRFIGWFPGVKWGLRMLGVEISGVR